MKFGIRKPSIKKSFKARTTGKLKRSVKKAVIPGYGKKGMGWIKNPKKAAYNKVYNKTTVGIGDITKMPSDGKTHNKHSAPKSTGFKSTHGDTQAKQISNGTSWLIWGGIMGVFALVGQNIVGFLLFGVICFFLIRTGLSRRKDYQSINVSTDHEEMSPLNDVVNFNTINYPVEIKTDANLTQSQDPIKSIVSLEKFENLAKSNPSLKKLPGSFNWNIMVSFGRSTSGNYEKAIYLAKSSLNYEEQKLDGATVHTAIFNDDRDSFIDFINLYEIVSGWKSTICFINGKLVDKKTVGKIKYCYGDKCRSVKSDFCYGASIMTDNPFGCHRLQISRFNNPWWGYYKSEGQHYTLDRQGLLERINLTDATFRLCPAFDLHYIEDMVMCLPLVVTNDDYNNIIDKVNAYNIPFTS